MLLTSTTTKQELTILASIKKIIHLELLQPRMINFRIQIQVQEEKADVAEDSPNISSTLSCLCSAYNSYSFNDRHSHWSKDQRRLPSSCFEALTQHPRSNVNADHEPSSLHKFKREVSITKDKINDLRTFRQSLRQWF
jgi:hypothetical protein